MFITFQSPFIVFCENEMKQTKFKTYYIITSPGLILIGSIKTILKHPTNDMNNPKLGY